MAYVDEIILKQQREQKETNEIQEASFEGRVEEGSIVVRGKSIKFIRQEYLNHKISMMMPDDVRPMTEEEINGAYLLGNRPQYLFHSDELQVSLVLNHTENPVQNTQTIKMAEVAAKLLEKAAMNGRIFRKKNIEKSRKVIATVELVSNGYDEGVYTLNFYISLENKLLLGNLNCVAKNMEYMREIAMQIVETIEINEAG